MTRPQVSAAPGIGPRPRKGAVPTKQGGSDRDRVGYLRCRLNAMLSPAPVEAATAVLLAVIGVGEAAAQPGGFFRVVQPAAAAGVVDPDSPRADDSVTLRRLVAIDFAQLTPPGCCG